VFLRSSSAKRWQGIEIALHQIAKCNVVFLVCDDCSCALYPVFEPPLCAPCYLVSRITSQLIKLLLCRVAHCAVPTSFPDRAL